MINNFNRGGHWGHQPDNGAHGPARRVLNQHMGQHVQQGQAAPVNLPPAVQFQRGGPVNQRGRPLQRPVGNQNIGWNNAVHQMYHGPQNPDGERQQGNQNQQGNPQVFNIPPQQANVGILGHGGRPGGLPQQGGRFHPYQGQREPEQTYDPGMNLEEAMLANWNLGAVVDPPERQQQGTVRPSNNQRRQNGLHDLSSGRTSSCTARPRWDFSNTTEFEGEFARSMSQICDPSSAAQGNLLNSSHLNEKLFNQIQLALAVKMGLNGPEQVKERALHNVLTSKSARGDLKQVLQSRAEIYGDELDPNWFKSKVDLGGKAKTLREKNQARAMLAGAPLLLAQLGALELRKKMMEGESEV